MNVSKQFTRRLLAAMVSGSLMLGAVAPAGASGISVVDIVGNAQTAANFIKEMAEMANQLNTMKSQLEQQRQQFKALTGSRNSGNIFKDAALDQVPDEWKGIYGDIKDISYKNLSDSKRYQRGGGNDALVQQYANTKQAMDGVIKRVDALNGLMNQINQTQDMKAAADLQNRIAVEQAKIANIQIALDTADRIARQDEQIRSAQQKSIIQCQIRAKSRDEQKACSSI